MIGNIATVVHLLCNGERENVYFEDTGFLLNWMLKKEKEASVDDNRRCGPEMARASSLFIQLRESGSGRFKRKVRVPSER